MILVRESSSAKGSRGRRDWRQEVVTQRMARGRMEGGSVFRESVWKRAMDVGKMEKKTKRDGEWPSVGMTGKTGEEGRAALKHSMVVNAAGARGKRRERDTKTGVVAAVHTSS